MTVSRGISVSGMWLTLAFGTWLLITAWLNLRHGLAAGETLGAAPFALPVAQLVTVLLFGPALTASLTVRHRLVNLLAVAWAPAPLAGLLLGMDSLSLTGLALGQLAVLAGIGFVVITTYAAERFVRQAPETLSPALQVAGLLLLWVLLQPWLAGLSS